MSIVQKYLSKDFWMKSKNFEEGQNYFWTCRCIILVHFQYGLKFELTTLFFIGIVPAVIDTIALIIRRNTFSKIDTSELWWRTLDWNGGKGLHQRFVTSKVEILLEQRDVAYLSLSKIWENLNFSRERNISLLQNYFYFKKYCRILLSQ